MWGKPNIKSKMLSPTTLANIVRQKRHQIHREMVEVAGTNKDLESEELVTPIRNLFNSPDQLPQKVDGSWGMTVD